MATGATAQLTGSSSGAAGTPSSLGTHRCLLPPPSNLGSISFHRRPAEPSIPFPEKLLKRSAVATHRSILGCAAPRLFKPAPAAIGSASRDVETRLGGSRQSAAFAVASSVDAPPSEEEASVKAADSFVWQQSWYGVAAVDHLEVSRPHPITVLGRRFVLWKDGYGKEGTSGEWRCFLDRCPHRLVPLSEGRIDIAPSPPPPAAAAAASGGNGVAPVNEGKAKGQRRLQCAYHGWSFTGDGACVGIPQAERDEAGMRAVASPRACAVAVPVVEKYGIIFVWPDETADGKRKAQATPLPVPEGVFAGFEHESSNGNATAGVSYNSKGTGSSSNGSSAKSSKAAPLLQMTAIVRDMWYGYEVLAENVVDPAHVPFAHHGSEVWRRSMGRPYTDVVVTENSPGGFSGYFMMKGNPIFVQFRPNLFVYYGISNEGAEEWKRSQTTSTTAPKVAQPASHTTGRPAAGEHVEQGRERVPPVPPSLVLALFLTPTLPGRCRLVVWEGGSVPVFRLMPRGWLKHLMKMTFLDGDAYFLHTQERLLRQQQLEIQVVKTDSGASAAHGKEAEAATAAGGQATAAVVPPRAQIARSSFYLPTNSDRFVIAFHQWLSRYGGGSVQWPAGTTTDSTSQELTPDWLPKSVVLDHYSSHVEHCILCQRALAGFQVAQWAFMAMAAAAAVAAAALARQGPLNWPLAGLAVVLAAASACATRVIKEFYFTGFDHAKD